MKLGLNNSVKNRGALETPTWNPGNISSLIHWYKYDTSITKDAQDDVTAWADQKGSNNLTATGVTDESPLYSSGAILFNYTNDVLTFGSTLVLGTFSVYMRMECSSWGAENFLNPAGSDFFKSQDSTEIRLKIDGSSRHDINSNISLSDNTKYNIGLEREDTGGAGNTDDQIYFSIDGVNKPFDDGNGTQVITETFDVVSIGRPLTDCKYYEIVVCNNSLSSGDRTSLNTYLNTI